MLRQAQNVDAAFDQRGAELLLLNNRDNATDNPCGFTGITVRIGERVNLKANVNIAVGSSRRIFAVWHG